uniref:Uncharacterized protein n=1 Tax=Caenorhabditis japonica TaxID=281687 RepID=A0A8R1I8U2_CAEJA
MRSLSVYRRVFIQAALDFLCANLCLRLVSFSCRPAATIIEMQATPPADGQDSRGPDMPSSSSPPPPFDAEPPTIQRNVSSRRSL